MLHKVNLLQNEGVEFGIACTSVFVLMLAVEYIRFLRRQSSDQKPRDLREQCANTASCFIFLLLTAAAYIRRPDDQKNDPSILLTTGAGLQLYAFCLLYAFPRAVESVARRAPAEFGMLFVYALNARTWCTMMYNGYLPADETGDGCIQTIEALTLVVAAGGVIREGVSLQAAKRTVAVLAASWVCAFFCYGTLDRRPWVDRYYASSLYAELFAWVLMLGQAYEVSKTASVDGIYLLPSFVQGVCRSYAWYAAFKALDLVSARTHPFSYLMAWFPVAIVVIHFGMSGIVAAIGALCIREVPGISGIDGELDLCMV